MLRHQVSYSWFKNIQLFKSCLSISSFTNITNWRMDSPRLLCILNDIIFLKKNYFENWNVSKCEIYNKFSFLLQITKNCKDPLQRALLIRASDWSRHLNTQCSLANFNTVLEDAFFMRIIECAQNYNSHSTKTPELKWKNKKELDLKQHSQAQSTSFWHAYQTKSTVSKKTFVMCQTYLSNLICYFCLF